MSQIIKVNNYDSVFVPSTPLSDNATIFTTFIKRSELELILRPTISNQYVYPEQVFLAELYVNELNQVTDIIKSTYSDFATSTLVLDSTDNVRTSYVLTVTSESGKVVTKRRIIPISLGASSPKLTVHTIKDNNFVNAKVSYFVEQNMTIGIETLRVGIIEVPTFNNTTNYFNIQIKTSNASSVLSYIVRNDGVEPNGLNAQATPLIGFNATEIAILDHAYVYAKVVAGTETLYFKLVQSGTITTVTTLDSLKKVLSNKYVHVFNRRTAILVGEITAQQIYDAYAMTDYNALRTWLTDNLITWYDVSSNLSTLTDVANTVAQYSYPTLQAYNAANLPSFSNDDVKDIGSSIASALYDIFNALPTTEKAKYTHTLNWFLYVKNRSFIHIVTPNLTESQRLEIISAAKLNYLAEFSHAYVLFNTVNKRWLEYFVRRLRYVRDQISAKLLSYEADLAQIDVMLLALTNIQSASSTTAAFDQYTETAVDTFATHLEYLKLKANTIQRITL